MMADLCILDADPSEPPSPEAVVNLANRLIGEFNIPTKIQNIDDISAALFVVLYESLFSDRLPGIIRQPASKEDEIHNCQIVIDVLSTDVVRDSLSHIRGVDIVSRNITAISNLLDIFSYLLEYVVNRIESDVQTDNDDTRSIATTEPDSDLLPPPSAQKKETGKVKKPISKQDKSKVGSALSNRTNNNGGKNMKQNEVGKLSNSGDNDDLFNISDKRKVITHEDYYSMMYGGDNKSSMIQPPSPIKPDHSLSLLGQNTSDFDIEKLEKKKESDSPKAPAQKIAWDDDSQATPASEYPHTSEPYSPRGVGATAVSVGAALGSVSHTSKPSTPPSNGNGSSHQWRDILTSCAQDLRKSTSNFSSSLPAPRSAAESEKAEPLRSTVGPMAYQSCLTPEKPRPSRREPDVKGLSSSYNDLRQLVEKTAALSRLALETSPVRVRTERDLDVTDMRDSPRPTISSEGARLAREFNGMGFRPSHRPDEFPYKAEKKVAFSSKADSLHTGRFDVDDQPGHLSGVYGSDSYGTVDSVYAKDAAYRKKCDPDFLFEERALREQIVNGDHIYGDILNGASGSKRYQRDTTSSSAKPTSLADHLVRNRQPELGTAHMTLRTEDRAMRRKQDILQKMYGEDLDEFSEEVKYLLEKDSKQSKETEDKLKKKCFGGPPRKKAVKKTKVAVVPPSSKRPRMRPAVSTKSKKRTNGNGILPASAPLRLESEEDLLPALLEEFPHLHLSEHTWHEMRRRGLHQIEALTRAYQESKRKKSQAQSQIEDAADRHDLLSNIMKKQLDHTKRLREIKEQKQQQVQVRNKTHEKRMQSARARRYYNEYQVRARGKQLKRRTKEEMVFRELFKDALQIQKERIKDIRQYATDQRKRQESRRQDEIDSMENYYHNQFDMLTERLAKERLETEVRDAAQQKMMERMKRELRKKMESEIKLYQEQMLYDDDSAHFRQVDADRIKQQLHTARYAARI